MRIEFDPLKRHRTLAERGLDFEDAAQVFPRRTLTLRDDRKDYGEPRFQTYGLLNGRVVMIVWTPRGDDVRRVISMRHCHDQEADAVREHLD